MVATPRQNRSSEGNFKYSIRKYFIDNLKPLGIPVIFDRRLQTPPDKKSDVWVSVTMENVEPHTNTFERHLQLSCCSVRDVEFIKLAGVVDAVSPLLTSETHTDGIARIPLLMVGEQSVDKAIGHMLVTDTYYHAEYDLENQTKVRPIRVRVWYAI